MTEVRPSDYWFSNTAIYIQLNAAGDPNYIHANCSAGSMVMCYVRGVSGLGYDNAHNYRRWTLIASPTVFHDDEPRYVFIAIPKSNAADAVAQVVFPSEVIDIYGKNASDQQIGSTDYYYINTQGIISASRVGGVQCNRAWTHDIDCGKLASDEAIASGGEGSWWEWNAATDMVKFLKTISEAVFQRLTATFAEITQLMLGGKTLNSVATADGDSPTPDDATDAVVTPAYASKRYLSKEHDDVAKGNITFKNSIVVEGETILKEKTTVGDFQKDIQVGIGSRSGIRLTPEGDIIARSLELSESLNVPVIKYNQIEVLSGTRWDSAGKGRIKEIVSTDDTDHTCQFILDLNDGEPGEFLVDDILRGFWHNLDNTKNAQASTDDRKGNIQRAGFMSLYCRVVAIANVVERTVDNVTVYLAQDANYVAQAEDKVLENGLVTVQMRQYTDTSSWSPYPEQWSVLSVSGSFSADPSRIDRQRFTVYTTTYIARFEGVNTWEWEEHTFKGGWGNLSGFSMLALNANGSISRKEFQGSGFVDENIYLYGVLDQFTRFSDSVSIVLSRPDGTIADGEQLRADFILKDIDGNVILDDYVLTITRQSGNATADAQWDADMAALYPNGIPAALYFQFSDIPENGAVYVIAATRDVTTPSGSTAQYTTSASFVLSRAYAVEDFQGPWDPGVQYTRTTRTYPTVTHSGCKWYLMVQSDTGTEPMPFSTVWGMVYGVDDMTIRFYDASGHQITSAACYPGSVNLYLEPRLLCGNIDITDMLSDSDWSWSRYTGYYGEATDTRDAADAQSDQGWVNAHWSGSTPTRIITLNNYDMPPTWGSGKIVNFIVTADFNGLLVTTYVKF